jgi:hypothetical protein
MANRKKPNLTVKSGFWVDPVFLPDTLRFDLLLELKGSGLDVDQQELFLARANLAAQMPHTGDVAIATQSDEMKKVASDARRLLNSLNALSEATISTFEMHAREAPILEYPSPIPFNIVEKLAQDESGGLLSEAWEWINALDAAAEYALSQQAPSKQAKPKQARARALVANLTSCFFQMTGKAPPADPASWFTGFVLRLAEHMDLEVGDKVLRSGINLVMKPEGFG